MASKSSGSSSRRPAGKTTPRTARKGGQPGTGRIPAFGAGLLSGLAMALALAMVGFWPGPTGAPEVPRSETPTAAAPPAGVRFEFPDMLRDARVLVPYVEEYLQPEAVVEDGVSYLLQAGAFRNEEDANRRRAQILLLDLDARTLRVTLQGATWHRVLVGPFPDRNMVRDAQLRLLEDRIDSIVLRSDAT
ncbi:MAG: SPOR domain-containing protein [Gammaproteobacteria bacterium]|nr:SPOR domain-containing protein [Gammaproteobacteria bacterium]